MGDILTTILRWVHISSVLTLIGGIVYARFVMLPAAAGLTSEARAALEAGAAKHFRPMVIAAAIGLLISGLYSYVFLKPGHSARYHALFGVKILLVLHVVSVAILVTAPHNPRRGRQLLGAAISGLAIVAISAYLKGIA